MLVVLLLSAVGISAQYNTRTQKAKFLMDFCKKYYPDGVQVLNHEAESLDFTEYADGTTDLEILRHISTVIHETYHGYESDFCDGEWECVGYYFGDGIGFSASIGNVFNTTELDKVIPASLKDEDFNSRYDPYIVGDMEISSHTEGLYGIMEEMNAYYLGAEAALATWDYYLDRYKGKYVEDWGAPYFSQVGSDILALHQFRFFVAWYLEYARDHYPVVYRELMADQRLRLAYTLLEIRFTRAEEEYNSRLTEFSSKATTTRTRVYVEDNFLWFVTGGSGSGTGVFTEDMKKLDKALQPRWQKLLDSFILKGATESNWKSYTLKMG